MLLPPPPDRVPDLEDDFSASSLRLDVWLPHYLPHWTTPDRSAARLELIRPGLRLRIEPDQLDWRVEDAPLRVSNIQSANFSGPAGSHRGTHPQGENLLVRRPQQPHLGWAPRSGRVDVTVTASVDPGCMTAAWLVGTEHLRDGDAGEICIFEVDAESVGPAATRVRSGIKAHRDARLETDMAETAVAVDATRPVTWTAIWGDGEVTIGCEGVVIRRLRQAPDYPLALMIDLFDSSPFANRGTLKTATVHAVRGWASG